MSTPWPRTISVLSSKGGELRDSCFHGLMRAVGFCADLVDGGFPAVRLMMLVAPRQVGLDSHCHCQRACRACATQASLQHAREGPPH